MNAHLHYSNYSDTLATGGELVFLALLDGTVAAFDEATFDVMWKINVGSGFSAPPMTFETGGNFERRCEERREERFEDRRDRRPGIELTVPDVGVEIGR
jgi:hypothetical protein